MDTAEAAIRVACAREQFYHHLIATLSAVTGRASDGAPKVATLQRGTSVHIAGKVRAAGRRGGRRASW